MSQPTKPTVVDRISDLPDDILCHILSFLPTKQAFTTILLSKRWNLLCYSLTTLSFDDKTSPILRRCDKRTGFFRFIDTLMLSPHVINQSLKTFCLKFHSGISDSDFYAWIEAAKRRRIEEFQLESKYFNYTVNPTFFISQTLVVLKLKGLLFKYETFCADLPLLKTLHLKRVRFEYQNDIIKLLKSSPNLEDLNTSFRISEKNFEVQEVKSLFLSKLVKADIRANNIYPIDVPFNVIHNVEFLRLKRLQVPSLQTNTKEIFKRSPVFQNLTHAKLWFRGFFDGWDVVVEFLRHCPKLQILYIRKGNTSLFKDWVCPILSPECVSSHLRSCTIVHFEGSKDDLGFATYILQNARVLEVMKINSASSYSEIPKRQIREELSTCPRMSPGCKFSFK